MERVEAVIDALLRSRTAQWVGLAVGAVALVFLVRGLQQEAGAALEWVQALTVPSIAALVAGFAAYQVGSVMTLRLLLRGEPALPIWTAAQLIKYLPVPGSAAIGMVGSTVRHGGTTRQGLGLIVRHSLLHVGAATIVGLPSVVPAVERLVGVAPWVTAIVGVAGGLAVAVWAVRHLRWRAGLAAGALTLLTWAALGGLLAIGFSAVNSSLLVAAAYPAGWVAGQLAVPVPAGIGVREAALAVLLAPEIGEGGAFTFLLGTRLLHLASDAGLILVATVTGGVGRRRQSRQAAPPAPE